MIGEVQFSQKVCPNCGSSAREVILYSNGKCSHCGAPPAMSPEMTVVKNVFTCPYCGSGSIEFSAAFTNGSCKSCGKGAGEVGIVGSAEKVRVAGDFGLVIYAEDAKNYGKKVQRLLTEQGVTHLSLADLYLDDVPVELRDKAIEWFVSRAKRVFVVVSPGADEDGFMKTIIKHTSVYKKAFPINTPAGGWDTNAFRPFQQRLGYQAYYVDIANEAHIVRGLELYFGKKDEENADD